MAKDKIQKEEPISPKDTIEVIESKEDTTSQNNTPQNNLPFNEGIAPYVAFLEGMRLGKKHLTSAPTFTPKNFYEQIQFYDTGGVRRLYLYINGDWRYVVLT